MIKIPAQVLRDACRGFAYRPSRWVYLPDGSRIRRHQFDQLFIGIVFTSERGETCYASKLLPRT